MKSHQILFLALFSTLNAAAQSDYVDSEKKPLFQPKSVQVMAGIEFPVPSAVSVKEFQGLIPESEILKRDLTGFNGANDFFSFAPGSRFSAILSHRVRDDRKQRYRSHFEIRTGVSLAAVNELNMNLSKRERKTFDTLTSAVSGAAFLMDSIYDSYINIGRRSNYASIDLAAIWHTNPNKTVRFYIGGGLMGGIGFGGQYSIWQYDRESTEIRTGSNLSNNPSYAWYGDDPSDKAETFRTDASWAIAAYVPVGMEIRLGKNPERIWQHLSLTYESRRGVVVTNISGLGTISGLYFSTNGGVKYTF
jgi:hypothetical protein